MHPNPGFRKASRELNIEFSRGRSFGTLAINSAEHGEDGPLLSHIPFVLDKTGDFLHAHLMRSNPILKLLDKEQNGVIAVTGPDSYVSPDWYGVENQVPTWNYIAVHLRGKMKRLSDEKLPAILDQLSDQFEQRLLPKKPWTADKMDASVLTKMMKMIVPIHMDITAIDGTWKLAQNKPEEARIGAAKVMRENGIGTRISTLADLMMKPPC